MRRLLIADAVMCKAFDDHAALTGNPPEAARRTVDGYICKIVPFFNIIVFYEVGYRLSRMLLGPFSKVSVDHEDRAARRQLPKDAVVVYLMNHCSNADYVLVGYALTGQVDSVYAVGERAQAVSLMRLI